MEAEIMYKKFTLSGQISSYMNYFYINDNPYNFEFFMTGHSDAKFQIAGLKWQMEFTFKKFDLYLRFTFGQIKHTKWVRSPN